MHSREGVSDPYHQAAGHGTLHCRMGFRGRQAQARLDAEGRIGGCRTWLQSQSQQHHQILQSQNGLGIGG